MTTPKKIEDGGPRERGMPFRGDMVLAILGGRKTQTRRLIDPQPDEDGLAKLKGEMMWHDTDGREYRPCWQVGDRIYVKEDFKLFGHEEEKGTVKVQYRDGNTLEVECYPVFEFHGIGSHLPWTGAKHMPRWASRLTLEVTEIRAQRIQEISEGDSIAEGVREGWNFEPGTFYNNFDKGEIVSFSAASAFRNLWKSLYPGSWERNEYVWVLDFKLIEGKGG